MVIEEGTPMFKQDRRLKRGGGDLCNGVPAIEPEFSEENLSTYIIHGGDDGFECGNSIVKYMYSTSLSLYIYMYIRVG